MMFRLWKKDRSVARPTGETKLEADHQTQPEPNPTDSVLNNAPDSAESEESVFGVKLLVSGEAPLIEQVLSKPSVDLKPTGTSENSIVAVHGLHGNREKTWTADNDVLWLQALLPKEIPNARVLTYGYDSRTRSSEHLTHQTLYGHSMSLISALSLYRRRTKVSVPVFRVI